MPEQHRYYVYILGNIDGTKLYTGVTNDLMSRTEQHASGAHHGFTYQTGCTRLLYFENHNYIKNAIAREKQIKAGSRQDKIALINSFNPDWKDLSETWFDEKPKKAP